jgi:hypothetical protein
MADNGCGPELAHLLINVSAIRVAVVFPQIDGILIE